MKKKASVHLRNVPSRERSSSSNKDVSHNLSAYLRRSQYSIQEARDYAYPDPKESSGLHKQSKMFSSSKKIQNSTKKRDHKHNSSLVVGSSDGVLHLDFSDQRQSAPMMKQLVDSLAKSQAKKNSDIIDARLPRNTSSKELQNENGEELKRKTIQACDSRDNKPRISKQSSLKKLETRPLALSYTKVFVMGDTRHGQLGFINPNEGNLALNSEEARLSQVIEYPRMCSYNILVKQIACGQGHTHILSQDGYVYSMGSNVHGVLGLGKGEDVLSAVTQPQLVPGLQCIIQIASGRVHSLALNVKREVYAWGRSDNGAIGLRMATPAQQSQPQQLSLNLDTSDEVIQIGCGLEHSCFLSADGHVFACGEGEFGQLGLGYATLKEYKPMRAKINLAAGDYVVQIACGAYHTAYLTRREHVYVTGLNNLGQLGNDSLEAQVNSPVEVPSLSDKAVKEVACGESCFAITVSGDLYVWGLYSSEIYRQPKLVKEIPNAVSSVSQSFYGVTAAIDIEEQAWYWHSRLDAITQNLLRLPSIPKVIGQMRKRSIKKVFTGKDLVFALGEDVNTNGSTMTVKESQGSAAGLQEIPERNERPSSSAMGHPHKKMPTLNLSKLHKSSAKSLKRSDPNQSQNQIQRKQTSQSKSKSQSKTPKSRSHSASKTSKLNAVVSSVKKQKKEKLEKAKGKSLEETFKQRNKPTESTNQSKPRRKLDTRSDSQDNQSEKRPKRRATSQSKSQKGSSQPCSRSTSKPRTQAARTAPKNQSATRALVKSKSVGSRPKKWQVSSNLDRQVAQRFKDLGRQLETDKEELASKIAKLSTKVAQIQKQKGVAHRQKQSKSAGLVKQMWSPPTEPSFKDKQGLQVSKISAEKASDVPSQSASDEVHNNTFTRKPGKLRVSDKVNALLNSQSYEIPTRPNLNMFNQEIQDEINHMSGPHLIFSPHEGDSTVMDIRSPIQPTTDHSKRMRGEMTDSSRQQFGFPKFPKHNLDLVSDSKPIARSKSPAQHSVKSPANRQSEAPVGYNAVRSPKDRHQTTNHQQKYFEQQLVGQLREQLNFLEHQNARLKEERASDSVKIKESCVKFDELRTQLRQVEATTECNLRSLESQLRTSKLEKQDMSIKLSYAERKIRELEERLLEMPALKRKEQDHLDKLGKSHEALRLEREKNRDLQTQNEFFQKTIGILETTVAQVKTDRDLIEQENRQLKEYLTARDLEVDKQAYNLMLERQSEQHGRNTVEEMERRSKSLGMRCSVEDQSRNGSLRSREHTTQQKRYASNTSLVEQRLEKSSDKAGRVRTCSKLSNPLDNSYSLLNQHPLVESRDKMTGFLVDSHSKAGQSQPAPSDDFYCIVQEAPLVRGSEFRTRESKDTGRFVEPPHPPNQPADVTSSTVCRDERIQRLLQEAQVVQEKHQKLMSQSPLRLKGSSAERVVLTQEAVGQHTSSSSQVFEAQEYARLLNYARTSSNLHSQAPDNSSRLQQSDQSPLRVMKCSGGLSPGRAPLPNQSFFEPPSQSTQFPSPAREFHRQDQALEDEPHVTTVREDLNGRQIKSAAGIANPVIRRPSQTDRSHSRKPIHRLSQERHPHFADEPCQNEVELYPEPKSQVHTNSKRKDNQDYIQQQRDRKDSGSIAQPAGGVSYDKERLEEDYNKRLQDKIDELAAQARNKSHPSRINKFLRGQTNRSSNKENSAHTSGGADPLSPPSHNKNLSQGSQKSNPKLPSAIFSKPLGADSREAYQQKLAQINRNSESQPEIGAKRAPSSQSGQRMRRPVSRQEDDEELRDMLVEPKRGKKWSNGLDRNPSLEREKQTAENNSFLARRQALQNRLKKL